MLWSVQSTPGNCSRESSSIHWPTPLVSTLRAACNTQLRFDIPSLVRNQDASNPKAVVRRLVTIY